MNSGIENYSKHLQSQVNTANELHKESSRTSLSKEELLKLLKSNDWESRYRAIEEAGKQEDIDILISGAQDREEIVACRAIEWLGNIATPRAINFLKRLYSEEKSIPKKVSILQAYGKIGTRDSVRLLVGAISENNAMLRNTAFDTLTKIGPTAVVYLIKQLSSVDKDVRLLSANILGEIGSYEAVEYLVKALEDEHHHVRYATAEALGKIGSPSSVDSLVKMLKDRDIQVRCVAASALGEIGDPSCISALKDAMDQSEVRIFAIQALVKIGGRRAFPIVEQYLDDPIVFEVVRETIWEIDDKKSIKRNIRSTEGRIKDLFEERLREIEEAEEKMSVDDQELMELLS